jgi:uracil-DNA glycosylase
MTVPSQFPSSLPCKIAFIAEAPSYEEVEKGCPLVGPSGRIFNSLLRTARINRDDCYVGNVFGDQIPENKIKNWCVALKVARENKWTDLPPIGANGFLHPDYRHHLDRLQKELEQCQPTVIVPLGGTALWALTGQAGITSLRGTALTATRLVPGTKIVPTFHPAMVMKKWSMYSVVVRDMMYAVEEAEKGKELIHAKRKLILEPTLDDLRAAVPSMLASPMLSVDIETGWGTITCIGFAWSSEEAICVPFFDARKTDHNYWPTKEDEMEAWKIVREVLASSTPKLGQNFAGYDFMWLLRRNRLAVRNLTHDTRLLHHNLYPELPKDLGFMGASHSSQGAWKHMGKSGGKRDDQQKSL